MRLTKFFVVAMLVALAAPAFAQMTLDRPLEEPTPYLRDSGAISNISSLARTVHEETVVVDQAAWVRIYFGDVMLGNGSFLRLTSELDGAVQELDADAMAAWENSSAYFNGESVLVELVAGPKTIGNRLVIAEVAWEASAAIPAGSCGICGPDDRVPSDVDYAARLLPAGCSSAVYNTDSCMVTAGHCISGGMVVQFKVPASSSNCSLNHPPPTEQFPISQFAFTNGGVGNDWGVMVAGTNNLGEKPYERYGELRPIATTPPATNDSLTIWGYGIDDQCVRTQVQQTSGGNVTGVGSNFFNHNVDATFGNSGSSIMRNGEEILGIVTHCPCPNWATRIDHPAFLAARESLCPSGPAAAATLTAFNVTFGTHTGGGVPELMSSDDNYATADAATGGPRYTVLTETVAQSPYSTTSELNLTVEFGAAAASPVFYLISLWNYDEGMWNNLLFDIVSTTSDTTEVFTDVPNPDAYVSPSGQIRVRMAETARQSQMPDGYTMRADHVEITVRP